MPSPSTSTTRRLLASAAVTVSLALTTAVAPAPAHAAEERAARPANVTVTIKLTGDKIALVGQVRSPKAACRANRKVALYYQARTMGGWSKIRVPVSNNRGAWRQAKPQGNRTIPAGRYYAQVSAKQGCKADRSGTIRVS